MNPLIQLKKTAPVFLIALVCFGLLPTTQAVSPAPHGTFTTFDPPGSIRHVPQRHHPWRGDHRILRRRKWRDARLPPDA